jgi:hypothetical protein
LENPPRPRFSPAVSRSPHGRLLFVCVWQTGPGLSLSLTKGGASTSSCFTSSLLCRCLDLFDKLRTEVRKPQLLPQAGAQAGTLATDPRPGGRAEESFYMEHHLLQIEHVSAVLRRLMDWCTRKPATSFPALAAEAEHARMRPQFMLDRESMWPSQLHLPMIMVCHII